jgi:DNA invertase Pin-like site-specific DNA recombinase
MLAAYLRVSSRSQDVEMQRAAILRALEGRNLQVDEWFIETASSVGLRPELERLREWVRGGRVERVIVFKLDRLTRSGTLELLNIVHEFRRKRCVIESVTDAFPLEGPTADLVLSVFAFVAEMERNAIRERLAHARLRLEREGRRWGRPRRVLDDSTVERIQKLKSAGMSVRKIAMSTGIPRSTVQDALSGKYPPLRQVETTGEN